jgi:hypothetical protein
VGSEDDAERSAGAGAIPEQDLPPAPLPVTPRRRRRITSLAFLAVGALVAWYLGTQGPQEQHLRVVLGAAAPDVTAVGLQYISKDGDVARETRFVYPQGGAPRVVAHEPQLPNGEYRLQIDVDARDGRRAVQRQVTLGGGSTQIDVSSALMREEKPPEPP